MIRCKAPRQAVNPQSKCIPREGGRGKGEGEGGTVENERLVKKKGKKGGRNTHSHNPRAKGMKDDG